MSLKLPADLEPYLQDYEQKNGPGAYALELERPLDLEEQWHRHNEEKPPYWSDLNTADSVYYVGGTSDLLSRLEDHRNGDKRLTALTRVCEIAGLQTAWPHDGDTSEVFDVLEPRLARWLQESRPDSYVHFR